MPNAPGFFRPRELIGQGVTAESRERRRKDQRLRAGIAVQGIVGTPIIFPPNAVADITGPIVAVVSETAQKVSRIPGFDATLVTFHGDEPWQQFQFRLVASDTDTVTMGTLVQNGPNDQSFETAGSPGGIGWTTSSGASQPQPALSFVATGATVGARSLQVASNGNINNVAGNFQQAIAPRLPIDPGETITVTADLNISVGNGPRLQIQIQFFDANGTFLAQTVTNVGNAVGAYPDQTVSAVAPANTATFGFGVTLNGAPGAGATATGTMTAQIDNVVYQFPANQDYTATITEAAIEAAGGLEGNNLLKVFLQDIAGNWST